MYDSVCIDTAEKGCVKMVPSSVIPGDVGLMPEVPKNNVGLSVCTNVGAGSDIARGDG